MGVRGDIKVVEDAIAHTGSSSSGYFVDWISARLEHSTLVSDGSNSVSLQAVRALGSMLELAGEWKPTKARFGYKLAWRLVDVGVVCQVHPLRADMGVNVIATGQVLSKVSWKHILGNLYQAGATFSRIDVSMDVLDAEFNLEALWRAVKEGDIKTRSKRNRFVSGETGDTLYIGSRTSEKFLRIYDKGAEQGDEPGTRFRVELECKGGAANFAADCIVRGGLLAAQQIIHPFFDAPTHAGYQRAIQSAHEAINIPSSKKRADTEAWLNGVVADCMAAMESINPGFLVSWYERVMSKVTTE